MSAKVKLFSGVCKFCLAPFERLSCRTPFYCSYKCNRKGKKRKSYAESAIKRRRKANPEEAKLIYKKENLKRRFGLTLEEYEQKLKDQNGLCAICKTDKPFGRGRFHVDHCHQTGKMRMLLCAFCNSGLGYFKDDPAILAEAILYLQKHKEPTT